jgi:hypothetical protein
MVNDLATTDDLADFAGAPFTDAQVDAAVGALRAHAGWHIAPSKTETLTVDGSGAHRQVLPTLHLTAVTEVRDTSREDAVEITSYRWSAAGILSRTCGCFPDGFQAVEADVVHGYDECPPELLASLAAAITSGSVTGVASRTVGPFSESYRDVTGGAFSGYPAVARHTLPARL